MIKITLSGGLLIGILTSNAQDTTCTYFTGKNVYHIDYQQDTILSISKQTAKFYEVNLTYGDVLCLHFYDKKSRIRKVIITFFDGSTNMQVLNSKDYVYFSPPGTIKVSVGKPRFLIACN